jgi:hypothetical protein
MKSYKNARWQYMYLRCAIWFRRGKIQKCVDAAGYADENGATYGTDYKEL